MWIIDNVGLGPGAHTSLHLRSQDLHSHRRCDCVATERVWQLAKMYVVCSLGLTTETHSACTRFAECALTCSPSLSSDSRLLPRRLLVRPNWAIGLRDRHRVRRHRRSQTGSELVSTPPENDGHCHRLVSALPLAAAVLHRRPAGTLMRLSGLFHSDDDTNKQTTRQTYNQHRHTGRDTHRHRHRHRRTHRH